MAVKSLRVKGYWHDGREVCVVRTPAKTPKGIGPDGEFTPTAKAGGKRRAKGPGISAGETMPELAALDAIASKPSEAPKVKRNAKRKPQTERKRPEGRGPLRTSAKVWRSDSARKARRERPPMYQDQCSTCGDTRPPAPDGFGGWPACPGCGTV